MRLRWRGLSLATIVICLTACTGGGGRNGGDPAPEPIPEAEPTTLESYDAEGLRLPRGPFCDRVSATGIEHALGDAPARSSSWTDGDRVQVPGVGRDRVHEFGCRWFASDGTRARAWMFVPPVSRREARSLLRQAAGPGCSTTRQIGFGKPSGAVRCTKGGTTEETYLGRFGDTWLTCVLSTPGEPVDLPERTSAWCVTVLDAARE